MDIRTFRASTLQEALEQVRETLGPDAAVLHTREVKRSRLGIFSSNLVEVEASIDMPAVNRLAKHAATAHKTPSSRIAVIGNSVAAPDFEPVDDSAQAGANANTVAIAVTETKPKPAAKQAERTETAASEPAATTSRLNLTESNAEHVRSTKLRSSKSIQSRAALASEPCEERESSSRPLSRAMIDALATMLDAGVEPTVAKLLMQSAVENLTAEQLNDALLLQGRICQLVGKNLRIAEPIAVKQGEQVVVAMIGSTGVGKTTTLAKIAKNLQADQSCEVGLLTMDIFRPGAVDQLLQYAESLDASLEVVSSANQFLPALQRLKHCDLVFIDTAGRSPNDLEQIQTLQEILDAAQPTSVQLVVSATSSTSHIKAAVQQFSPLRPTGLVITKLDEAIEFGAWLSVLQQVELPVSYIGHGQRVPQDIMPANRRRLASFLLGHAAQLQVAE